MKNKINLSMRCNQEQWELLKPKLENVGYNDFEIDVFEEYKYMTNFLHAQEGRIGNIFDVAARDYNREVHEEFNEKIFLEACGVFEELKFEITKETVIKYQMKDEFPEVFRTELVIGNWYKGNASFDSLINITEVEKCDRYNKIHYYGFTSGTYRKKDYIANTHHEKSLAKATTEEVTEALKNEALKRYKKGDYIRRDFCKYLEDVIINKETYINDPEYYCNSEEDYLEYHGFVVYSKGQWATVIPTKTVKEAEELLNCKIIQHEQHRKILRMVKDV